jgi:hypothetical protein
MLRRVTYECRDIGYGLEDGQATGLWGDRDWTGKRMFVRVDGPPLYLFDDEILNDEAVQA